MSNKQPTLFVSHGNPMLALDNKTAKDYRTRSETLPKPKAILIFSAHWETSALCFGETSTHNTLVYNFHSFPKALYQQKYPAPGSTWLKDQVQKCLDNNTL